MTRTSPSFRPAILAVLLAALCLVAGSPAAQAQDRTEQMTCAAARQIVVARGAVVLNTSPTTFDRFVNTRGQCLGTEVTEPAFVPTSDDRRCFIGYRCREPMGDPSL